MNTTTQTHHTQAWILEDTGFADIRIPKGACVLIAPNQSTFYPEAIRILYKGQTLLVWPERLTYDPMEVY